MKRRNLLASGVAAAALATMGLPALAQEKTKVGFVYVGPVGDGGWTYEHDQARQAVEAEFGDAVETVFVESVPEGPDAERVMTQMALDGADLIFTTSFGYMDPTINVAAKFPDVKLSMQQAISKPTTCPSTLRASTKAALYRATSLVL